MNYSGIYIYIYTISFQVIILVASTQRGVQRLLSNDMKVDSRVHWDKGSHDFCATRPGKQTKLAIENGPVEIVDLPSYRQNGGSFHRYVNIYQRVYKTQQAIKNET
jgi:hypothetical protein